MLLGSVSSQQRFAETDIKGPLCMSQLSGLGQTVLYLSGLKRTVLQLLDKSVLQLHATALFYLEVSRRIHPQSVRACQPKDKRVQECASAAVWWGVGEGGWRKRERKMKSIPTLRSEREREKALWLLLLYIFPPPGPALCKLGLARSAVCST